MRLLFNHLVVLHLQPNQQKIMCLKFISTQPKNELQLLDFDHTVFEKSEWWKLQNGFINL